MDSVTSKIEQQILKLDRGSIFFPDDFVDLGTSEAIRQSLTRLCKEGLIIRIAQGIYCYPEIEEKLGLGILQPSFEQIAEAMAKRGSRQNRSDRCLCIECTWTFYANSDELCISDRWWKILYRTSDVQRTIKSGFKEAYRLKDT